MSNGSKLTLVDQVKVIEWLNNNRQEFEGKKSASELCEHIYTDTGIVLKVTHLKTIRDACPFQLRGSASGTGSKGARLRSIISAKKFRLIGRILTVIIDDLGIKISDGDRYKLEHLAKRGVLPTEFSEKSSSEDQDS